MDSKKKILLVDDEQINLEFFDLMLTKLGFVVDKAENGFEALERIQVFEPDLVLLDNIMPRMSGWEVTKLLKTSPEYSRWSNTPIVMFSAMDDVKDKIEGFELGVDDYITKPFNFSEVLARIRAVLRNHELIQQLKMRESRIAAEDKVTMLLSEYAGALMAVIDDVCNSASDADTIKQKLAAAKQQYCDLQVSIAGMREEVNKLKSAEIAVQSLEQELRKSFQNNKYI